MKKIVKGKELQEKMEEAITLLCSTVKTTLGPMGSNVIIDHSNFRPFITNDGVTIARNIESEDEVVSAIIEIAKEAAIKTDEIVGDGTTTTLVLLESLINLSQEYIKKGINPLSLKKSLDSYLEKILCQLAEQKECASIEQLKYIAAVSAKDKEIGDIVGELLKNIDDKSAITIKEKNEPRLSIQYYKGYTVSISHPAEYYFQNQKAFSISNAYILIIDDIISSINDISDIINSAIIDDKALIIIAEDFEEYFINNIMSMNFENKINCFMIKINEYGLRKRVIEADIAALTESRIIVRKELVSSDSMGKVKQLYLDKDTIRIEFDDKVDLKNLILRISNDIEKIEDEYEKDFLKQRRSMFSSCLAEVNIGSPTKIESHEKKMRLEDAINAAYAAKEGILPGGGIALLKLADKVDTTDHIATIWAETLKKPFEQIIINSALDKETIEEKIKEEDYRIVYNVCTNDYENINDTSIIDPFLVVRNSLINACSIAGMLLTTTSIVINEYQNNLNKENDFSEI